MSTTTLDTKTVRRWKRYPEYRNSEPAWLGSVPAKWHCRKLKLLLSANDSGVWGEDFDDEGTIVLRSTDLTAEGRWNLSDPARRRLTSNEIRIARLKAGDLVVTKSSGSELHLGKTGLVTPELENLGCCFSNFMQRLRPGPLLNSKFFWWVMNSPAGREQMIFNGSTTTGLANLGGWVIGETVFPLPLLLEQRAIAAFLDCETARIDALIVHKERLITLLEEKRQAVISHAVTRGLDPAAPLKESGVPWLGMVPKHWKVMRIADASRKITNGFVGPTRDILLQEGVRYLQSLHIKDGQVLFEKPYYVSPQWSDEHRKSVLKEGDVLLVQTGACVGQVAAVPKAFEGANCHALIIVQMLPNSGNGFFLSTLLCSQFGQQILLSTQEGATLPHLECGKVREIRLAFPPLDEQAAIVNGLERVTSQNREAIAKVSESIARLQEYRTALISAAVTGQIDVRGEVTP